MSGVVQVVDAGSLHRYRTEIPNTVVRGLKSRGLSIYAKWLYVYLKSVAGDHGICRQGISTLVAASGLSRGQVSRERQRLKEAGLIRIEPGRRPNRDPDHIYILDIWIQNMQEFSVPGENTNTEEKSKEIEGHISSGVPGGNSGVPGGNSGVPGGNSGVPGGNSGVPERAQKKISLRRSLEEDLLKNLSPSETSEVSSGVPRARSPRKSRPPTADHAPTSLVWNAYAGEYQDRYGVPPVRNARVNAQLKQFVQRVPQEEAAPIAAFYVWHASAYYQTKGHPIGLLLADAEKLHTEWKTHRPILATQARQQEKTASNPFLPILDRLEKEAKHDDQR